MDKSQIQHEINKVQLEIDQHKRWLTEMTNPMKIRFRKRDLKNAEKRLAELTNLLNQ